MKRTAKIALGVGCLITAVNHGDDLLAGDANQRLALTIMLNVLIPFCRRISAFSLTAPHRKYGQHRERHCALVARREERAYLEGT